MTLVHLLDNLRCSFCGALNTLWGDPIRCLVECRECGQGAVVLLEIGEPA